MQQLIVSRASGVQVRGGRVCALAGGLALIDERVASAWSASEALPVIFTAGQRIQQLAFIVLQAVTERTIEHAPLVVFGLGAVVLTLWMTRS